MDGNGFYQFLDSLKDGSGLRVKKCRERTLALLRTIRDGNATLEERNAVITAIKFMQSKDFNDECERQIFALTGYYLSPERPSLYALAEKANCSNTTIKRDRELAVERLALILYGADAIEWE